MKQRRASQKWYVGKEKNPFITNFNLFKMSFFKNYIN